MSEVGEGPPGFIVQEYNITKWLEMDAPHFAFFAAC